MGVIVVGLLLVAGSAWAVERALNLTADVAGGTVEVSTGPMPKGLFNSKNSLARSKSSLILTWSTDATDCAPAASGTVDAAAVGEFDLRQQAYHWTTTLDLSSIRHQWNNHLHCDGTTHMHGCDTARAVTLTATLNTPGAEEWGQESTTIEVAAADQGPDTAEDNCGAGCDGRALGACTQACQQGCNDLPKQDRNECHAGCHCSCAMAVGCNDKNCGE